MDSIDSRLKRIEEKLDALTGPSGDGYLDENEHPVGRASVRDIHERVVALCNALPYFMKPLAQASMGDNPSVFADYTTAVSCIIHASVGVAHVKKFIAASVGVDEDELTGIIEDDALSPDEKAKLLASIRGNHSAEEVS